MPATLLLLLLLAALTPTERKLRASAAGLIGWANTVDRAARSAPGQRGLYDKFFRATDPSLPEDLRAKQADARYRAHMRLLALKGIKARRERKEQRLRDAEAMADARRAEALKDGGAA